MAKNVQKALEMSDSCGYFNRFTIARTEKRNNIK